MTVERILTNARIVTPNEEFAGTVHISDGAIADVAQGRSALAAAEDLDGDYVIPGLIDLHTDNLEKHFAPRPNVRWHSVTASMAHDAQVAGAGITTVYDSLALVGGRNGADRQETLKPMVDGLRYATQEGMLRADHFLHLRCEVTEPTILALLEPYLDDPLLQFVSIMDHTPGQRQFSNVGQWRATHKALFGYSEEDMDRVLRERRAAQETYAPDHQRRVAAEAQARSLPLASHDDESVAHVEEAAALGIGISEFPVTMEAARAARAHGMSILMGSPNLVRGGSHSGNVSAAELAREGLIDIFASDYVPISLLHAALMLTGASHGYALPAAVATVTHNPARAVGLTDRGRVAAGLLADLVRFRMVGDLPVVRSVWRRGRRVG